MALRISRHYYDIHRLMKSETGHRAAIANMDLRRPLGHARTCMVVPGAKRLESPASVLDDRLEAVLPRSLLPSRQAYASATAVFRNEFDARLFKGTTDRVPICYGDRRDAIHSFCAPDCRHSHTSCIGQILSAPTY